MNKKKVLVLALAVIMIAILSFSTLAWFSDDDEVTNDFMIAGSGTEDPDDIFSVDVWEDEDGDGEPDDDFPDDDKDGLEYEDILPGDELEKAAFVKNTGSYNQYIRVTMTISDWAEIKDLITIDLAEGFQDNWKITSDGVGCEEGNLKVTNDKSVENGNLVVVMFLNKKLAVGEEVKVMDLVKISTEATRDDFKSANFADGFQIDIKADAVQTENVLDSYEQHEWQNAQESFAVVEGNN